MNSLWVQWAWTCLLCLSGSYGDLLDYVIFAVLIFYILTIVGLFVLRVTQPRHATSLQGVWLPGSAGAVYRDGDVGFCCTLAIQTSIHLAGPDPGSARGTGVSGVATSRIESRCKRAVRA